MEWPERQRRVGFLKQRATGRRAEQTALPCDRPSGQSGDRSGSLETKHAIYLDQPVSKSQNKGRP